ncbi:MAG: type II secretion system protein [Candidatus Niyogibacteria bacterium]|nr:type II secretion system protein [Candidatus Niyogibacteria bacterium]
MKNKNKKSGFTLLELLIVVAIMAILSVVMIIILDPAETLKKSRDSQRMSDLNTLKTAIGIYLTATSSPQLDNYGSICLDGTTNSGKISYSIADMGACNNNISEGADANGTFTATDFCDSPTAASGNLNKVNGSGWIPVPFSGLTGGSPISNLPIDPINTVTSVTAPTTTDMVYRYACQETGSGAKPGKAFELDARLESAAYGPGGAEDKSARDGGDNNNLYEVGSSVFLMGSDTGSATLGY